MEARLVRLKELVLSQQNDALQLLQQRRCGTHGIEVHDAHKSGAKAKQRALMERKTRDNATKTAALAVKIRDAQQFERKSVKEALSLDEAQGLTTKEAHLAQSAGGHHDAALWNTSRRRTCSKCATSWRCSARTQSHGLASGLPGVAAREEHRAQGAACAAAAGHADGVERVYVARRRARRQQG